MTKINLNIHKIETSINRSRERNSKNLFNSIIYAGWAFLKKPVENLVPPPSKPIGPINSEL